MRALGLLSLLPLVLVAACSADADDAAATDGEPTETESAIVPITEPDETAPATAIAPAPLEHADTALVDVRGVGDAG